MKRKSFPSVTLALGLIAGTLFAAPTEEREWTSTAGTKIRAMANAVADGEVELKTADGRVLKVPLDKLVATDREMLESHFEMAVSDTVGEGAAMAGGSGGEAASGLAHPLGAISGPISTPGDKSQYLVYLPQTLVEGRKAPVILYTGPGGGGKAIVNDFVPGAELCGWIVACSMNSRNGQDFPENHEYCEDSLKHLFETLPIDEDRVYFSGSSGGGATCLYNAGRIKHAGAMPMAAYMPGSTSVSGGNYFFINGATDYNRYTSANAVKNFGDASIQRFHPGGHGGKKDPTLFTEGMVWLNGRYLADEKNGSDDERLDYEAAVIEWIEQLKGSEPWRAYALALFLKEEYGISSANTGAVEAVVSDLGGDVANVQYADGLKAIDDFARKEFGDMGTGSKSEHTTAGIQSAARKLASEYSQASKIVEIANALAEPTVPIGGKKK
ncbi:MAG: hypothetical protein AAF591_03405 [Verrucomicrobiota bacterium]